ncbi:MAG: CHAD domain-containing protein [Xanthobacteraceae bacterium]|nr:CHAD domain-containing protein [Xanthobacteraceae bacterium]
MRSCLNEFVANEAGLRANQAKAVHRMRVAGRRLQSALAMFDRFAGKHADRLKDECNWLIDELSFAREIDVFAEDVLQAVLTGPGVPLIVRRVEKICMAQRRKAYRRANAAVLSLRYRRFLSHVQQMAVSVDGPAAAQHEASEIALKALSAAWRELKVKKRIEELSRSRLHKLRLRSKRMRYSAEIAKGLLGKDGRSTNFDRLLKALSRLQSALGAINDIAVHKTILRDFILAVGGSDMPDDLVRKQIKIFLPEQKKRRRKLINKAARAYDAILDVGMCWA